jgi:hypothetical protein
MKLRSYLILHSTDGGEGGKAKTADPPPAPDLAKIADDLIKKHGGDHGAAVRAILADRDGLATQLAETRARLPRDGHRVIDPDTGKVLDEFLGLGLKPADVTKALADRDELGKRVAAHDSEKLWSKMGGLVGFKASVLQERAEKDGLVPELGDAKDKEGRPIKDKEGRAVQVPYVKDKDDGDKPIPLTDYAAKHWGDYLPALKPDSLRVVSPPLGSPPASGGPPRPAVVNSDQPRRSFVS